MKGFVGNGSVVALAIASSLAPPMRAVAQPNVVAWGDNSSSQTNVPSDLTNAIAVAGGDSFSLALRANGTLAAWGSSSSTNVPANLTNVIAIAAGRSSGSGYGLALKRDGTVAGWGVNSAKNTPSGLSNVVTIAAGDNHALALINDGTVVAWGQNSSGQTSVPRGLGNVCGIAAGADQSLAVKVDGTVIGWGNNFNGQALSPASLSNAVNVAAGSSFSLGLRSDGKVVGFGTGTFNPGTVPPTLSNVVAVATGSSHGLALRADGTVFSWGYTANGRTNVPSGLSGVGAIAGGLSHSLAIVGSGAPIVTTPLLNHSIHLGDTAQFYAAASGTWPLSYQWQFNGTDMYGATRFVCTVTNVQATDLGSYSVTVSNATGTGISSNALLSRLSLFAWSDAHFSSPATCPTNVSGCPVIRAISGGYAQGLALKTNGTIFGWGTSGLEAIPPSGLSNVVAVSGGRFFSVALRADGKAFAWGQAVGSPAYTNLPSSWTNVAAISAAYSDTLALNRDGTISSWPSTVATGPGRSATAIAAGGYTSVNNLGLLENGTVLNWPVPQYYPLPGDLTNVVAISAGEKHFLALRDDGTVTAWGDNAYGQTNVPSGLTNVVAIAAEKDYASMALKADGTVVVWGQSYTGSSFVPASAPPGLSNIVAISAGCSSGLSYFLAEQGNGPPLINTRPLKVTAYAFDTVRLNCPATGEWPFSYQWQFNGSNVAGATQQWLVVTNVQFASAGEMSVVVSNSYGSVTGLVATLGVTDFGAALGTTNIIWNTSGTPWVIETNVTHDGVSALQNGIYSDGSPASGTLEASVSGPGSLTFWWKTKLPGSGSDFLSCTVNGATMASIMGQTDWQQQTIYLGAGTQVLVWSFQYFVPIPGSWGAWLDQVTFTPGATAPFITSQPASLSQGKGANATFSVTALGTPPLSYKWQYEGTDIPGTTSASFTLTNVQAANAGNYVTIVSNAGGTMLSSNATLAPGLIATWGNTRLPLDITNAVAVAGGYSAFGLALQADGTVQAWGDNCCGQTNVPGDLANVVALAAGGSFGLALKADRTVVAWGDNSSGQTNPPAGLSNVVAIAGGRNHALALKADGTVTAWGNPLYGATNVPTDLTNVVAIAAEYQVNLALKADGTVVAWGYGGQGQTALPSGLTNVVGISVGLNQCSAVQADGKVAVWGSTSYGLTNFPPSLTNAIAIGAGGLRNIALQANGTVIAWGLNNYGDINVPEGLTNVVAVAAGGYHSIALVADATPALTARVGSPSFTDSGFNLSLATRNGMVYRLEYLNSLDITNWISFPLFVGDGSTRMITDFFPIDQQRFYRVRQWSSGVRTP